VRDFDGRRIIEPSTWGRLAGKPIAPTAANETRAPPMNMGCTGAAPFPSREETRSEDAQPVGVLPCPHLDRISSPIEPRGFDPGRSSTFFRYRSHSSFVDGRDARLVMVRSPSGRDQRSPRQPPLRAWRLYLWRRSKGACSEDLREGVRGTRSNQILSPQHRTDSRKIG